METVSLLYWLSFYKISKKVIFKIDKLRKKKFYLKRIMLEKKYVFIAWKIICQNKKKFQSLLAKWLFRLQDFHSLINVLHFD
jgi:hypothetical protein